MPLQIRMVSQASPPQRFLAAAIPGVKLLMMPSEYRKRNFVVTFEGDFIGIRTRDGIGVDNFN